MSRLLASFCSIGFVGCVLAASVAGQSRLSVQGEPYFDGVMTLSLEDAANPGAFPLIAYGLTPLHTPLPSAWGP